MKIALSLMPPRRTYAEEHIIPFLPGDLIIIERPDLKLSDGHELAWHAVRGDDWGMVIHDDVRLCQDFINQLVSRLDTCDGKRFISLYSPRKTARLAFEKGKKWERSAPSSFLGEEAVIMRHDLLDDYLNWLDNGRLANRIWHDEQLQMFLRAKKEPVWICLPNLVDHATDILPSLVRHSANCFGNPRRSTTYEM